MRVNQRLLPGCLMVLGQLLNSAMTPSSYFRPFATNTYVFATSLCQVQPQKIEEMLGVGYVCRHSSDGNFSGSGVHMTVAAIRLSPSRTHPAGIDNRKDIRHGSRNDLHIFWAGCRNRPWRADESSAMTGGRDTSCKT
jgi:hypothetical protein